MSRYRSTKYNDKPKIRRSNKGNNINYNNNLNTSNYIVNANTQDIHIHHIPLRGINRGINPRWDYHINNITNQLIRLGLPQGHIQQAASDLSNHLPKFLKWGQWNVTHGRPLSSDEYINDMGGTRGCGGCSGTIGSCNNVCTDLHIDVDNNNSWDPKDWNWNEGSITVTIYFTIG